MRITNTDFVLSVAVESPVVFSISHEGLLPGDLDPYFSTRTIGFRGRERYLSTIAGDANSPAPCASLVRGLLPRSICDYNRPEEGVEDVAFLDAAACASHRTYHETIRSLLSQAYASFGRAYLIDLHGFSSDATGFADDLILGSNGGKTCRRNLDRRAEAFFDAHELRSRISTPGEKFSGGYTVIRQGSEEAEALQIEISSRFRREETRTEGRRLSGILREFVLSL